MGGPDDLMSISDAARLAGVSSEWLRKLCDSGRVPAIRTVAGQRLFRRGDIENYAAERKRRPPQRGRPKKKVAKVTKKGKTKP